MRPSADQRHGSLILAHHWVVGQMSAHSRHLQAVQAACWRVGKRRYQDRCLPNGITFPDCSLRRHLGARQSLGSPLTTPLVVCAARLEAEKDVASLAQAMSEVTRELPQARCLVAGDGALREALKCPNYRGSGLAGIVQLLGFRTGCAGTDRRRRLVCTAQPGRTVRPGAVGSHGPGQARRRHRAGGPLEIVVQGETGLLVPPAAPDELAEAILRLLRDPRLREAMGRAGRTRYAQYFTAARMAEQTLAVYRQAAGHSAVFHPLPPTAAAAPSVPD